MCCPFFPLSFYNCSSVGRYMYILEDPGSMQEVGPVPLSTSGNPRRFHLNSGVRICEFREGMSREKNGGRRLQLHAIRDAEWFYQLSKTSAVGGLDLSAHSTDRDLSAEESKPM